MNAYERLMAEAVPTGSFGRARPPKRQRAESAPRWTPEEQAAHLATLNAALDGFELDDEYASNKRDRYREQRANLRVIPGGNPASRTSHRPIGDVA